MQTFEFKQAGIMFNDFQGNSQKILDYRPIKNHSSTILFSMNDKHRLEDEFLKWLKLVFKKFRQYKVEWHLMGSFDGYLLSGLLLIKQLLNKQRSFHVLEIGCGTGAFSILIAEILKHFNSANRLVCVSEETVNANQDIWLQLMAESSAADIVSRYIGDFTDLPFKENYFDLIIINGTTSFKQAKKVFQQAVLVLRNQGIMYGIVEQRSDLVAVWSGLQEKVNSYPIDKTMTVYSAQLSAKNKQSLIAQVSQVQFVKIKRVISENLANIKKSIFNLNNLTTEELDDLIKLVGQTEDKVLKIFNQLISLNLKFYLSQLKEALINYRLDLGEKSSLKEVCQEKYRQLLQEVRESEDF